MWPSPGCLLCSHSQQKRNCNFCCSLAKHWASHLMVTGWTLNITCVGLWLNIQDFICWTWCIKFVEHGAPHFLTTRGTWSTTFCGHKGDVVVESLLHLYKMSQDMVVIARFVTDSGWGISAHFFSMNSRKTAEICEILLFFHSFFVSFFFFFKYTWHTPEHITS